MKKLMEHILSPQTEAPDGHLGDEELARLAEGKVDKNERQLFIKHLNRCSKCYDIFKEVLIDLPEEKSKPTRTFYAIAASIILCLVIGGGLIFKDSIFQPGVQIASIKMDKELRTMLMENKELEWTSEERIKRLTEILQKRDIDVESIEKVVMTARYIPSKDLFGPKEYLQVRLKNRVIYLEVVLEKP